MTPRLNRLKKDYEKLQDLAIRSAFVTIESTKGEPPTEYVLILTCKGVQSLDNKQPIYSEFHRLRIRLHDDYPRRKPEFALLTPIFHPNVSSSGAVCIGDEGDHGYAPSMGLDDIVIRIIEMIRYENFSARSAFNHEAGQWAQKNQQLLPLDRTQIVGDDVIKINILDEIRITGDNSQDLLDQITIL